jgi:hypothetical protein
VKKQNNLEESNEKVRFLTIMSLDFRNTIKAVSAIKGVTMNSYILQAISEAIERDRNLAFHESNPYSPNSGQTPPNDFCS